MRFMHVGVAGVAVVILACGGGDPPTTGGSGGGGGTGGGTCAGTTTSVSVNDDNFNPSCTRVAVGATVTWTWAGSSEHNVTFTNTQLGASQTQSSGEFQKSFPNAGTFTYSCTRHPGMDGSVVVP